MPKLTKSTRRCPQTRTQLIKVALPAIEGFNRDFLAGWNRRVIKRSLIDSRQCRSTYWSTGSGHSSNGSGRLCVISEQQKPSATR